MAFNFSFGWGNAPKPLAVETDSAGNIFYKMFSCGSSFTSPTTDREKLNVILQNPAALKVFKLNCDLCSLAKIHEYKNGEVFNIDALKEMQATPNKHQTWKQFIWDYMFYNMLGTAHLWRSNNTNLTSSQTSFYWLNPAKITFNNNVDIKLDKLDLSNKAVNEVLSDSITYQFKDGSTKQIKLSEIQPFFDLSNSVSENWYKGNSAIDALYKIIANSEIALSAKNANLDYSRKWMVSGQQDPNNTSQIPMAEPEKKSIEDTMNGSKNVHAVKSQININRFVDDIAALKLDESFLADYFMIGTMYGIPRDVLEANLRGSTYENQEKATGKHISYSIQPKMDDLMEWFGAFLGVELRADYTHLPFMQVFEKDRSTILKTKVETFTALLAGGYSKDEAAKIAGI